MSERTELLIFNVIISLVAAIVLYVIVGAISSYDPLSWSFGALSTSLGADIHKFMKGKNNADTAS